MKPFIAEITGELQDVAGQVESLEAANKIYEIIDRLEEFGDI